MTDGGGGQSQIPAGFTYLGQFIDHDLTFDKTTVMLGHDDLAGGSCCRRARRASISTRSTARARRTRSRRKFYEADGVHLKMGKTAAAEGIAAKDGFDLPRGAGNTAAKKRKAIIPDPRNDENLAVAQTHLALIRFHNRVVDTLPVVGPAGAALRDGPRARDQALPVDAADRLPARASARPASSIDVFNNGRKAFEVGATPTDVPTMPIEFSIAAYRLGHSMIRARVQLERDLRRRLRHARPAVQVLGHSGDLGGGAAAAEQLDRRLPPALRLQGGRPRDLAVPAAKFNRAMRIDTRLAHPLAILPPESFGGRPRAVNDPRPTSRSATSRGRRW